MIIETKTRTRNFMRILDLSLFKESVLIAIATFVGRSFGFLGSMLLARIFDPADYGIIQYTISMAMLMAIGVQPIGQHVIARYIGISRTDPNELKNFLSNIFFVLVTVFGVSIFLAMPFLLISKEFNWGIPVVFIGVSIFFVYLGITKGYLALGGYIAADAGSSIIKVILILIFIWALGLKSTQLAIFIHGLSFVIPLILLQFISPVKIAIDRSLINKKSIQEILHFSLPVWLSHASYMAYMTIALIYLEHYASNTAVGVFSLASSLSILFSFIPIGFSTFLMPKIAGTPSERHKNLLYSALLITMCANLMLLCVYYFLAPWCIEIFFGVEYLLWPNVYFILAIVTICLGIQGIITSVFVGKGRVYEETKSRLVTFAVTAIACWYLVPVWGVLGAAWAMLVGAFFGLLVCSFLYIYRTSFPTRS